MVGTVTGVEGDAAPPSSVGAEADAPEPSGPRPAVPGPALIVLGIAVLIVVLGLVGSAIASNSSSTPTNAVRQVTLSDGTAITLTPATTALHSLVSQGQPPPDVLDNLAVPAGSRVTATVNSDQGAGQFDRTVDFATSQAGEEVEDAFRSLLPRLGWQLIYVGPALGVGKSGTEVLAKRGSSDGYEWEVGLVVSPTTAAGTTPFSVRVFEQSDDT